MADELVRIIIKNGLMYVGEREVHAVQIGKPQIEKKYAKFTLKPSEYLDFSAERHAIIPRGANAWSMVRKEAEDECGGDLMVREVTFYRLEE